MSDWDIVGTKQVTDSWILFPNSVTNTETFRVTSSLSSKIPYKTYGWIGQFFFGSNEPAGLRRVWPITDSNQIIELKIPEHLRQAGYVSRFFGCKLKKNIKDPNRRIRWFITLESLIGAERDRIDDVQERLIAIQDAIN